MDSCMHATSFLLWVCISILKCAITVVWALVIFGTLGSQRFPCANPASEPHDSSGLVHWCFCVCMPQRKRQQKRAHTLQVAALEFSSVRKLRTFWTVRKLSTCRERHCKICLTGSLHAHGNPKMLRIPALDHSKPLQRIPLLRFSLCVCLCLLIRGWKCSWTTVWIPRLQNFPRSFLFWSQKNIYFWRKNPIRCDFLLFRLIGWLVVIWYYF